MISKIPDEVKIPIKKQAPKWRLNLADWVLPVLSLLIPCIVMAIDQLVYSLTSSPDSTLLAVVLIPLLMLLKRLLTSGTQRGSDDPFDSSPHNQQQSSGVPIYTESGELLNNTLPPRNTGATSADPHCNSYGEGGAE